MAQYLTIETKLERNITLYDRNDYDETKDRTIIAIDELVNYLLTTRKTIEDLEPDDIYPSYPPREGQIYLRKIINDIYESEHEEYGEWYPSSGYCEKVMQNISMVDVIARNLFNQKRFEGKIEENCQWF